MKRNTEPIIILGFGRSGTTWVSDIISKGVGGLALFEPFHPEVLAESKECCYHNGTSKKTLEIIDKQIEDVLSANNRNKWLLRNHLSTKLDDVSQSFVDLVWDECDIIGFKAIRQNFLIPHFYKNYTKKIVFVKRDVRAVTSSLINRNRFWEEYGFEFHIEKFLKEITNDCFDFLDKDKLLSIYGDLKEDYLKMVFIWSVSHLIVEQHLSQFSLPLFHYEDFYLKPFETTRKLFEFLEVPNSRIHPSYLFTPPMLTLKTTHEFMDEDDLSSKDNLRVFWEKTVDSDMEKRILGLVFEINNCVI